MLNELSINLELHEVMRSLSSQVDDVVSRILSRQTRRPLAEVSHSSAITSPPPPVWRAKMTTKRV